jgi:secreted trypsin-like serine protease
MKSIGVSVGSVMFALVCGCGSSDSLPALSDDALLGGSPATEASLDAVGALVHKAADGTFTAFCTATLVAPDVLVTAKHCVTVDATGASTFFADTSTPILFAVGPNSVKPKRTVKAKSALVAPVSNGGYPDLGSDVAVVFLAEKISDIKPLRLDGSLLSDADVGKKYLAVGFGVNDQAGKLGQRLKGALTLQAASGRALTRRFPSLESFHTFLTNHGGASYVTDHTKDVDKFYGLTLLPKYEAYLGLGDGDAQPCNGDSGGPLLAEVGTERVVVAVVSASFKGYRGSTAQCSSVGEVYASFGPRVTELFASTDPRCKAEPTWGRCDTNTGNLVQCVQNTVKNTACKAPASCLRDQNNNAACRP